MNEKKFVFYWDDDRIDILRGGTPQEALNKAGYNNDAMDALDYCEKYDKVKHRGNFKFIS